MAKPKAKKEEPKKTKLYIALKDFVFANKVVNKDDELELHPRQAVWLNVKLKTKQEK